MKWMCSLFLVTVSLLASVPVTSALQSGATAQYQGVENQNRKRKKHYLPEGSGGLILVLAGAAVGGGLLVWRKKRAPAA